MTSKRKAALHQRDNFGNGPLTRYGKLRVAHAPAMPGTFSPPPRANDPDRHHGKCVTTTMTMKSLCSLGRIWITCTSVDSVSGNYREGANMMVSFGTFICSDALMWNPAISFFRTFFDRLNLDFISNSLYFLEHLKLETGQGLRENEIYFA